MQAEEIYVLGEIELPQYQLFNQCPLVGMDYLGKKIDAFNPVIGVKNCVGETSK